MHKQGLPKCCHGDSDAAQAVMKLFQGDTKNKLSLPDKSVSECVLSAAAAQIM